MNRSCLGAPGPWLGAALCLCLLGAGCIKNPSVLISDRQTALEQQASGDFRQLEGDLDKAGVTPRPVPFTRGQVEAQGGEAERLALAQEGEETDDDRLDRLLVRRCVGEAKDGTVADTRGSCTTPADVRLIGALVERTNRNRWQVWRFLQQQRPSATMEQVQREWRKVHLDGVVCKGQIQRDDGTWSTKECDKR